MNQRILICLRYGIGDVVMELPALRGLRRAWPAAEIHLLGARPALELFEGDEDFQSLVCIQDFGFAHWGDSGDPATTAAFAEWFRRMEFHRIFDPFHAVYGVHHILTTAGLPWRNSNPFPQPGEVKPGRGVATLWRDAVNNWGLPDADPEHPPAPRLHIPFSAQRAADDYLNAWNRCGGSGRDPVGIAPIASSELKRWPIERVLELVNWLVQEQGRRVLIFGLDHQSPELLARLRAAAGDQALAVLAPVHLQQTAALAARCSAFISNDTGLMHLAAAVGTPTVGIFGPTAAQLYLPPGAMAAYSRRPCPHRLLDRFGPPDCVPADRCLIASHSCIHTVGTGEVIDALGQLWEVRCEM